MMNNDKHNVTGAGLGLRRGLIKEWLQLEEKNSVQVPDFIEVTPDNWMGLGGRYERELTHFTDRYDTLSHGLSLSLGGPDPLDTKFIDRLGHFLDQHRIAAFSEHLSYCTDGGHLYDLIPLPFTAEAVEHVSARIRAVQKQLGRRIAIENVSTYAAPDGEMNEIEFLTAVLNEADCDLLLDVNNVYVNSHNHAYDAQAFIASLPTERISWLHVAGHLQEAPDLIIDTHGDSVVDPVWDLLEYTYKIHGHQPTLLERDFNLPPMQELLNELQIIRRFHGTDTVAQNKSALAQQQYAFTQALRDPDNHTPPAGVSKERLAVYQELFFNNVRGILESTYPVLHEIMPAGLGETLARRFFKEHSSHTPEFPRLPREFLLWIQQRDVVEAGEPDFLYQLALWEWTELDVLLSQEESPDVDGQSDFLANIPVVSPTLRMHAFDYPVHRISADFIPQEKLETQLYLAAFRTPEETIEYIELTPVSAALVTLLLEAPGEKTGEEAIRILAESMGHTSADQLLGYGEQFFNELFRQGIIIGTRANCS